MAKRTADNSIAGPALALVLLFLAGCASSPRDGAPSNPPSGLSQSGDAEPRVETIRSSGGTSKPYTVAGVSYAPITDDRRFRESGLASWYGKKFHAQPTASGEAYDMYAMTAAHKTLPLPSYVRVRNPANGREAIVRVNDRGPFVEGRVIDLSYAAAAKLDLLRGVAPVEIERITNQDIRAGTWRRDGGGTVLAGAGAAATPVPSLSAATGAVSSGAVSSGAVSSGAVSSGAVSSGAASSGAAATGAAVTAAAATGLAVAGAATSGVATSRAPTTGAETAAVAPGSAPTWSSSTAEVPVPSAMTMPVVSAAEPEARPIAAMPLAAGVEPPTGVAYAASSASSISAPRSAPAPAPASAPASALTPAALSPDAQPASTPPGFWIQIGAFSQREGAQAMRQQVVRNMPGFASAVQVFNERGMYRVQAGPYASRAEAGSTADQFRSGMQVAPIVVERR